MRKDAPHANLQVTFHKRPIDHEWCAASGPTEINEVGSTIVRNYSDPRKEIVPHLLQDILMRSLLMCAAGNNNRHRIFPDAASLEFIHDERKHRRSWRRPRKIVKNDCGTMLLRCQHMQAVRTHGTAEFAFDHFICELRDDMISDYAHIPRRGTTENKGTIAVPGASEKFDFFH
jgi:hypothetical protein